MFKKVTFLSAIFILAVAMLLSGSNPAIASEQKEALNGAIFLYTGSPLILSNGEIEMLDSTNPDIAATVVQSRTLLPLRALSEYFGAEVSYDQSEKEAIIDYQGKRYIFPINEKKYIVDDGKAKKEFAMDSQSMILSNRTMVPIRVICENVLGSKVSYFDRVIAVASHEVNLQKETELVKTVKDKIGAATKARSMKELGLALAGGGVTRTFGVDSDNSLSQAMDTGKSEEAITETASNSNYSTTNVQVAGIDEADVVKTDGKYIYIAGNNVVRIVGANKGKLSDDTAIRLATDKNVQEIYLDGDKLILLGTRWEDRVLKQEEINTQYDEKSIGIMQPYYETTNYSFVDVYDITNPLRPTFVKGHEMEGSYQTSRKSGEIVYLITNTAVYGDIFLPMMKDTVVGNEEFRMNLDDVMVMPHHPASGFLVLSAINVNNAEKTEVEAITAYGATMYMNDAALYLTTNENDDTSSVIKFQIEGMKIGYAGSGDVPGYVLNQFSMDEHEGNLRVATTTWENENGIFILDDSLNIIGSVDGLAKGESIYSVRFMGDKGYVVTFRNIDPLFVFDLSDPKNPKVTGQLKIPGFSNYLHPIGEDLLLGIGAETFEVYRKDANGNDVVIGSRQGGIKFSLFDISDMGKPKEISKYVIGDSGSSTEAFYNHKAIMVDASSGNVAIDAYLAYENQKNGYQQGAIIMSYTGNKLELKGVLDGEPSGVYGNDIPYARRILYIGDQLYYVQDGRITSYGYDNLKQIDTVVLQ